MKKRLIFLLVICTFCFCSCQASHVDLIKQKKSNLKIGVTNRQSDILIGYAYKNLIEHNTDYKADIVYYGEKLLEFTALAEQKVDVYIEDAMTIYSDILGMRRDSEAFGSIDDVCKAGLKEAYGLLALNEIGYSDNYVFCMKNEDATKYNIKTMTNILPYIDELTFASDFDWNKSVNGYDAFFSKYGFSFSNTIKIEQNLAIDALIFDNAQIICVNAMNPNIKKYSLFVLEDDRDVFFSDVVYPIMNEDFARNFPEIKDSISMLSGKLDDEIMMNHLIMIEENNMDYNDASKALLVSLGLLR